VWKKPPNQKADSFLTIKEISFGDFDEDDIVRLKDKYK
jgi:hypothetical protein